MTTRLPTSPQNKLLWRVAQRIALPLLGLMSGVLVSCGGSSEPAAYYLSHHPEDHAARPLRHFPVARQGNLTAWVTSDHVRSSQNWLYAPDDIVPKYKIVGQIRAKDMPEESKGRVSGLNFSKAKGPTVATIPPKYIKHDGAFLIVKGYDGPLYELWTGKEGKGQMYTGKGGWVPVALKQDEIQTWVYSQANIGGWSGYPVVIGDPAKPDFVVGAMWYRVDANHRIGGTTSGRLLEKWLSKLEFAQFIKE